MYQGDETYTFRSERPGRDRQTRRLSYDPPEATPPGRSAAEERVARLEAAVTRLEELLGQVVATLSAVEQRRSAPPVMDRTHGTEQAVQMLDGLAEEDEPTAAVAAENLRVSLFAEGGASAVLGQVRILE